MAKSYRIVKLVSEEDTGYYYTTTKPNKGLGAANKLRLKEVRSSNPDALLV